MVGGGEDPYVDRRRLVVPDAANLTLIEDAQSRCACAPWR
jgi:hypothetical protein